MSSPLVVEFEDGYPDSPNPMVYLHWGGEHSQDARLTIESFLSEVKELPDSRLNDASYLAAKLVVWTARDLQPKPGSLDFLSVGVVGDAGYGNAHIIIDCVDKVGKYKLVRSIDMEESWL